jgi:hypothetical protein
MPMLRDAERTALLAIATDLENLIGRFVRKECARADGFDASVNAPASAALAMPGTSIRALAVRVTLGIFWLPPLVHVSLATIGRAERMVNHLISRPAGSEERRIRFQSEQNPARGFHHARVNADV